MNNDNDPIGQWLRENIPNPEALDANLHLSQTLDKLEKVLNQDDPDTDDITVIWMTSTAITYLAEWLQNEPKARNQLRLVCNEFRRLRNIDQLNNALRK
jgi:hypothetical protein